MLVLANSEVDGVEMDILVDTGAERSIMSSTGYTHDSQTEAHTILEASDTVFDGIGGRKESYGLATFTYRVGDRVFKHPMNVIDMTDIDAILGMDMLTFIGASINVRSGLMTFDDGGSIQLSKHMRNYSATMCVDNPIRLKAMQARVISTTPMAGMGILEGTSQGIVEPMDPLFKEYGLITATAVVHKARGRILIYIMNPNTYDLILPKGHPCGYFSANF